MELRDLESYGEPGAVVYLADCVELMRLMPPPAWTPSSPTRSTASRPGGASPSRAAGRRFRGHDARRAARPAYPPVMVQWGHEVRRLDVRDRRGDRAGTVGQGHRGARLRLLVRRRAHPHPPQPEVSLPGRRGAAAEVPPDFGSLYRAHRGGGRDRTPAARHGGGPPGRAGPDHHGQGGGEPRPRLRGAGEGHASL